MEECPRKSPRQSEKSERMEFAESHVLKGLEFWKTVYFLMRANIVSLVQMDVIMCGEYMGKNFLGENKVCPTAKHGVGSVMV